MPIKQPLGAILDIVPGILPIDLEAGANNSDYISLRDAAGVLVVVFAKYAAAGTDDITVSLFQATAVAGTSEKDLNAANSGIGVSKYWKKQAATVLTGTGTWTEVSQTASEDVIIDSSGESVLAAIYVDANQLDVNGGFDCLCARIPDAGSGGAYIGALLYIPVGLAYPSAPAKLPNLLID